ncbi:TOTE conflict system archaeo-eukaryotic primase domain-containing protein [Chengkuizengella sp. SCS-71B]|uniref:TOTE conflict system archaeo-eukaryotic primase domain-containing protein n=1 Tax=Chengkuizengella sp. SCS-71B TaxID=3115290 RepID=UPI0032C22B1C
MDVLGLHKKIKKLLLEIEQLQIENISLRNENARLKEICKTNKDMLKINHSNLQQHKKIDKLQENIDKVHQYSNADLKISLFRNLFCTREDIYAVRWESKTGKMGYSPSCSNECSSVNRKITFRSWCPSMDLL